MSTHLTFGSLFAGIGGFDLGLEETGHTCRFQVEIDRHCQQLLRAKFPQARLHSDVRAFARYLKHLQKTRQHDELSRYAIDALCGGSPCQGLSVAGIREGLADERSGLFREMVRIALILRPRLIIWENVIGAFSSAQRQDFARVLGYLTGIIPQPPAEGWGTSGVFKGLPGRWHVAYRVLDAQHFGVAQRRRRIILVGSLGDPCCAPILFEPDSLLGYPPPRSQPRQEPTGTLTSRLGTGGPDDNTAQAQHIVGTLCSNKKAAGSATSQDAQSGHLIVGTLTRKWAKGTGGPSGDECQNLVADPITANEGNCTSHAGNNPRPRNLVATAFSSKDHGADAGPLAPTRRSMGHRDSHANGGGQVAVAFEPGSIAREAGPVGEQPLCPTLRAAMGDNQPAVRTGLKVRRLTPLECERLQGFPDNWTAGFSDATRYRMLGNAVNRKVATWLGRRLNKYA